MMEEAKSEGAIDPRRWTVVCKHWLKGLCQKDERCEYLHQYDLSRMPICSSITKGRPCTDENCVFKHNDPNQKPCVKYAFGFCSKGPACKERHERTFQPPDYLPDKYFAEIINPFFHTRVPMKTDHLFVKSDSPFSGNTRYFLGRGTTEEVENAVSNEAWATPKQNHKVLKEALRQCENVALVLIDSVNCYGFAKILGGPDSSYKPGLFPPERGACFRVRMIKRTKTDLHLLKQFRNPYDGNTRVITAKDSQEIDPSVGEKFCIQLMQYPDLDTSEYSRKKRQRTTNDKTFKRIK